MKTSYRVEHDSDDQVCIIPKPFISMTEFFAITKIYSNMGYKYWLPVDERGGYILSKKQVNVQKVFKIMELKQWVTEQIRATPVDQFPRTIDYHESMEEPVYTVTISVAEQDFYTDKRGTKWLRQKQ